MSRNQDSLAKWIADGASIGDEFPWTCAFCGRDTTITTANRVEQGTSLLRDNAHGPQIAISVFVICPNKDCREVSLDILLYEAARPSGTIASGGAPIGAPKSCWRLVPASDAKVYPDYIPKAIRDDYTEACLIRDLSPKASATLSRRCLQGMIRDFFEVKEHNLYAEIEAIKDKVAPLTWDAIDAVRGVGNIGAHMEKDINTIVEVEPREAAMLTGLIEGLIADWYITRHEREQRLKGIVDLGEAKKRAKKSPPPTNGNKDTG